MKTGRYYTGHRLYRNRETGVIMGVCSGIAEFFEFQVWMVRVLAVFSLLCFTTPTALAYVALGLLLRDRPLSYRGREDETGFWRGSARRRHEY